MHVMPTMQCTGDSRASPCPRLAWQAAQGARRQSLDARLVVLLGAGDLISQVAQWVQARPHHRSECLNCCQQPGKAHLQVEASRKGQG